MNRVYVEEWTAEEGGPPPRRAFLFPTTDAPVPLIPRSYDDAFRPDPGYLDSLPDMTHTVDSVEGADVAIQQVGVSGFRLPLRYLTLDGQEHRLESRVTGTVSLEAGAKGINMSRIPRTFYDGAEQPMSVDRLAEIAANTLRQVGSREARLKVETSYPMILHGLRSGLPGYQYYRTALSVHARLEKGRVLVRRYLELDFVYSSACPCSAELAEHARAFRKAYAVPHSQRSRARLKVRLAPHSTLHIEDLIAHARRALVTETQVLVKREDEQAFAELNGAYLKFVEDAARLVFEQLDADPRLADFQVACSHLESLHSHDAVSCICKGVRGGFRADFEDYELLAAGG